MVLSSSEFNKVFELVKWGVEKQGLSDSDFLSAYEKLYNLHNKKAEKYIITVNQNYSAGVTRSSLSNKAKLFIDKRIEEGKKDTYHSIMAILDGRWKRSMCIDKEEFRKEYIEKHNISTDDYDAFNEVYDVAYSVFFSRNMA